MKDWKFFKNKEIRREIKNQIEISGTATKELKTELNQINFVDGYSIKESDNGVNFAINLLGQGWSL